MDYLGVMCWPRSPRDARHGPVWTGRVVRSDLCYLWNSDQFIHLCAGTIGSICLVVVESGTFSREDDGISHEMAICFKFGPMLEISERK